MPAAREWLGRSSSARRDCRVRRSHSASPLLFLAPGPEFSRERAVDHAYNCIWLDGFRERLHPSPACLVPNITAGELMMPTPSTAETPTPGAVRLIFEYEGDTVRLISQQPVQMAITAPDTAGVDHPGYYVDVRNSAGRA